MSMRICLFRLKPFTIIYQYIMYDNRVPVNTQSYSLARRKVPQT